MTDFTVLAVQDAWAPGGHFTWIDWAVIVGYFAVTTWIGHAMAGKQATIRDFFLGGRKLPWPAVAGAIIATEISAVTFVGVPAIMFAKGGNLTYLQLGLFGSILARVIVGYVFVPVYYAREIYSPYDYMANQLGGQVRTMTTCLFTLGGMLAQGARVYLTAVILDLIIGQAAFGKLAALTGTHTMTWSIVVIGVVAIGWTLMGGMTTVIWTDVLLFAVFFFGGFTALGLVVAELPGGWGESIRAMCRLAWDAKDGGPWGKFTFFDFSMSPAKEFTVWTAVIAASWGGLGSYGTDQLMSQRMFCCRNERDARRAIIASGISQITTTTMLFVGIGLYAYYAANPLAGTDAALVAEKPDRVFPLFIIKVVPTGIAGLLIAAIFAAAISSLDGILTALSQTTMHAFYLPWRAWRTGQPVSDDPADETTHKSLVRASRVSVLVWGIVLCSMAYVAEAASEQFPAILNLALSMAGYTGGALLAGFMLAFLRLGVDGRGFMWSGPLSVLLIFALVWHQPWTHVVCWSGAGIILVLWLWRLTKLTAFDRPVMGSHTAQTLVLVAGLALVLLVNHFGYLDRAVDPATGRITFTTVAWPWFTPIGSTVAFAFG
ncbi:MAG TPA: hypothetical protein VLM89_02675, partial [Phycisphaerae bacterium]|nr:hypothetical protein [Phycisphaerae bacterium]